MPPTADRPLRSPAGGGSRTRGSTPAPLLAGRRNGGRPARLEASPECSRFPAFLRRRCGKRLDELGAHGVAADGTELRVGGDGSAALRARDDGRRRADGTTAVAAEVRAPDERCTASTAR